MNDIQPMTPEALSQYIGRFIGKEWAEYFERLQANLVHRDELYEAALVKIREYEDHILTLGSQLAAVTEERDELEVDLFNALAQLGAVRKEISDLRAYIAVYAKHIAAYAKPLVTPND